MIEQHEFLVGFTRTGKTYSALARYGAHWPGRVLFWNPQAQEIETGSWTDADLHDDLDLMFRSPRARINYLPSADLRTARKELAGIVRYLMRPGKIWTPPVAVFVDEVDEVSPQGQIATPGAKIAKRGGKHRVWGIFASQFPAEVTKEIVRNCARHTLFPTPYGAPYFKKYGMPGDEIERILAAAPKYSYMTWTHPRELAGPFTAGPDGLEKKIAVAVKR